MEVKGHDEAVVIFLIRAQGAELEAKNNTDKYAPD
jgi:hypothetical protein